MSVRVMTQVWDCSRAGGTDLLVLLAIADQASDDGTDSYPSVRTLARKARVSERTVQRSIATLADLGELHVALNAGRAGSNRYRVLTPVNLTPLSDCHPCQADAPAKGNPRQADTGGGDTHVTGGVTPMSPEPSLTHPEPSMQAASGHASPNTGTNHTDLLLADLQAALHTAGIPVGIPPEETTREQIRHQIVRVGIPALVISARAQWQHGNPARYMTAFLAQWRGLASHRTPSPARPCPDHGQPLRADGECSGCAADRKAAC